MNAAKVEAAKFRMMLAGASAIGQLQQAVKNDGKVSGLDDARSYVAQWHAAQADLDAAIAERDPREIEETAVRG